MLEFIGVIAVCLLNIFLGVFVLARNPKSSQNRTFGFLVVTIVLWALANYFANTTTNMVEFLSRAAFGMALLVTVAIYIFSWVFPRSKNTERYQRMLLWFSPVLFITTLATNLVVGELAAGQDPNSTNVESGPLYLIFIFYVILLFALAVKNYIRSYRESGPADKNRIRMVGLGIGVSFTFIAITSALVPYFTNDWTISRLGPFGTVVMVGAIAYAIIKHKLFDIRLVVARSLGYLLSIGALAVLYGLISFAIINLILPESVSLDVERGAYTLLAVVLAFSFQPLKRFFDRWSNKLFYRDAYDAQELLDSLNKVLVSTIEIEKLLTSAAQVIATNLKAEFILFGIKETSHSPQRILGTVNKEFSDTDISMVRQITPAMRVKTVVADDLEDNQAKLRDLMRSNDIAALVRLTDTPNKRTEGLGYIVLGNKKSGSPFTQQDIKVLEIIADELVIAIQNALRFEEIKNFNVTLQDKVDDATKQLRKANQRLIELDQTKDDFISMASHQLRTPLTSVKGYISMVMEGDAGKITKKQTELLDQAFVSSQRMVYLIADLLNVSRLRTGKFVIEAKPTNLADVIEGEISQLKETAKGRNLELTYTKPKDFPELMLDETKIRQVIMNFADNAIYYTPQGGHIQVNLEDKGDAVEFTVVDDGIGVPKSEQHNLFNKFYRAGNAKKARPDGTGLGLFMAKKVVVAQGGSIIFKTQENKGSTFGFSFTKKALLPENFKGVQSKS